MAAYDFMVKPYCDCIKVGYSKIDDVEPEDLKNKVTEALAEEGLGVDGKPLEEDKDASNEKAEKAEEDK
ncbi:MAG: hypothetical protein SOU08_00080 [Anaerococcus sp.]|nr:hypothetical protein [Anaerococcus sp.]